MDLVALLTWGSLAGPPAAGEHAEAICKATMVRRVARKGANAGAMFWGCSAFPKCRGTR